MTQTLKALRTIRLNIDPHCTPEDIGYKLDSPTNQTTLKLDSHANICVVGCDALIILDCDQPVFVVGYDKFLLSKTYKTVSGVVAYNNPQTGRMLHLIINQAIHIPHLDHHLLCPMRCCVNDVIINNLLKFLAANLTDQMHALTINDPTNPLQPVILSSILRGVTSLLNVRNVTIDDFNSQVHSRLHLTSEILTWDPTTTLDEEQETAMTDYSSKLVLDTSVRGPLQTLILNVLQPLTTDLADVMHNCNFHSALTSQVVISSVHASLTGHAWTCKTAPIVFKNPLQPSGWRPWSVPNRLSNALRSRVFAPALTPRLHDIFQPMTGCSAISGFHIICLLTCFLLGHPPIVEISVPKPMQHSLVGQGCTL
jgi:hypothetical protein